MYGCSDAYIIYGFLEDNREYHIDTDYLENYGVDMFAVDVVRNCLGEAAYGVRCDFDNSSGRVVQPSDSNKKLVESLYEKFMQYHNHKKHSHIGYYLVVSGDYETCHTPYSLE
jgi:hypothetical protein